MINLIPPEGHRVLKREYALRVGSTFLLLMSVILMFLSVAHIPTYVLVKAQINSYMLEASGAAGDAIDWDSVEKEVATTNSILAQMSAAPQTALVSAAIQEIERRAQEGIIFKTFYTQDVDGVVTEIQVQGVAPTRAALAAFKAALESSDMFVSAEVPISDLARDVNLPFAITVVLEPPV